MAISKDFYKAKSKSRSSLGTGAYYEAKDAQAVQDKSAVIWSQAIQNFSAQTAKAIDAKAAQESQKRKDAKDLMDRTMRYTLEEQTRVYDNLQKLGVNNPSIFQNADVLLDKRFDAYSRAAAAKTPEEQKAALDELAKTTKQLTGLETLIQQGTDASKVYSDDVNNGNLLGQGTLNLSGEKNLQWAKMMNIRNGINEGTESWGMDENGDWTITYDGPELGGPVTQKAALFFGYDPGTIPKVDDYFKELFTKVGAIDKNGELTDKYIDPNQIIQPTNDKNFSQVAYNVNKGMLAADTAQQINAYAKGLAHSLPDAEAAWDNVIPEDIKKQVANKYGVENFSDLQPGAGFGFGQLDKNSGLMFTEAMELYGNTRMQNQKLGNVVKNQKPPALSAGMVKEMQRTQDWQVWKDDFDLKSGQFNIGVNDRGVYTGKVDLDAPNFAKALNTIGFEIVGEKENKGSDDNYYIGLEVKSPNGKKVIIQQGESAQDFVAKLLRSMGATYAEGAGAGGGYQYNSKATDLISKYSN